VAYSPDGKTLASTSGDKTTIKLWDVATGKERATIKVPGYLYCLAYSPDGKMLASGGSGLPPRIMLWDVTTGKEQATLKGHTKRTVFSVAYSPDGKTLASGGEDGTIKLWDMTSIEQGGIERSVARLNAVLLKDQKNLKALFERGQHHVRLQEYDKAIADFTQVINLDPRQALAHYQRGMAYAKQEKYGLARADLDKALALDPEVAKKIPNPK
jgi:WD40 repeat protein